MNDLALNESIPKLAAESGHGHGKLITITRRSRLGKRFRAIVSPDIYDALASRLDRDGGSIVSPLKGLRPESRFTIKRNRALYRVEFSPAPGDGAMPENSVILKHESFPFPTWLLTLPIGAVGLKERRNLCQVESLGVPVVSAVAAGEIGWGPFFFETWVATREIFGGCNLSDWLRNRTGRTRTEQTSPDFSPEEVRAALPELAKMLALLHRRRFYCRTIFAKNVLMHRDPGGQVLLTLHDLPRSRYTPGRRTISLRRAVFDLACFDRWACKWLGSAARLRLLKHYLEHLDEGPPLGEWVGRIHRRRSRLMRQTFPSWLGHRIRRRAKKLPRVGSWVR